MLAEHVLKRPTATQENIGGSGACLTAIDLGLLEQTHCFTAHAHRQIDQINRRVLLGEVISP